MGLQSSAVGTLYFLQSDGGFRSYIGVRHMPDRVDERTLASAKRRNIPPATSRNGCSAAFVAMPRVGACGCQAPGALDGSHISIAPVHRLASSLLFDRDAQRRPRLLMRKQHQAGLGRAT
jgi:hypothetical protein